MAEIGMSKEYFRNW